MALEEKNKITSDYFYSQVAKKTGVSREIVKDIYLNYLKRVKQVSKLDVKVVIKGLGVFEVNRKILLSKLYSFNRWYKKGDNRDYIMNSEYVEQMYIVYINKVSDMIKKLKQLEIKYVILKKALEHLRSDNGGIGELFDNEGNCRRTFKVKDVDLRKLPFQLKLGEDLDGVQEPEQSEELLQQEG